MLRKISGFVALLVLLLTQLFALQRCANPLPPKGGPRDTIGPSLVLEESTPNFQTNFRPQQIEITFDEWVKLKDPTQVVVSPPLDPAPKISLKKKSLVVDFGEAILRDSATYVVNVGGAVVDLTEGNEPDNVRFVFSTGPVLDSASVRGQLLDAYTKAPVEGALFTLYENLADTAVRTENPFYFAKSDENGNFEISNIRPGTYRGIALQNGNQSSYNLDQRATKQLGFLDSFIVLSYTDTAANGQLATSLDLKEILLSDLPTPLRLQKRDTSNFGIIRLTFDRPANNLDYRSSKANDKLAAEGDSYLRINNNDTLELFYQQNEADSLFFGLPEAPETDTLILPQRDSSRAITKGRPRMVQKPKSQLSPLELPTYTVSRPIGGFVDSLIRLRVDTFTDLLPVSPEIDSLSPNVFRISAKLAAEKRYEIQLLPGAIVDIFGKATADTVTTVFTVQPINKFGTLNLTVTGLDSTHNYVFRLMKGKAETPTISVQNAGVKTFKRTFAGLEPATYTLEIIEDRNRNGRFDGADYDIQRQPEPVQIFVLEALRADWEVEATVELE